MVPRALIPALVLAGLAAASAAAAEPGSTGGSLGKSGKSVSGGSVGSAAPAASGRRNAPRERGVSPGLACRSITGVWSWFIGGDVVIRPGGRFEALNGLSGTWTCAEGVYVMVWSHGFTDRLVLSADGRQLSGSNNWGTAVSGSRK